MDTTDVQNVLFDFGGVIADEGFKEALALLAEREGLDPQEVVAQGFKTGYDMGFSLGRIREDEYWPELKRRTGLHVENGKIKNEIFARYRLREWMLEIVDQLRSNGIKVHLLSDQSHWLDDLDHLHGFYRHFNQVFCSFHMGRSKKNSNTFRYVLEDLGAESARTLFIDDHPPNLDRAREAGLRTMLYRYREQVLEELHGHFAFLDFNGTKR
jgi:putative hydrolase of the HAD superfamily